MTCLNFRVGFFFDERCAFHDFQAVKKSKTELLLPWALEFHHWCGSGGETNAETTRSPRISTTTTCFKQWATVPAMLFDPPRVDVMDRCRAIV